MNYDNIDVDAIVEEVFRAEDEGRTRRATSEEVAAIRLAALRSVNAPPVRFKPVLAKI